MCSRGEEVPYLLKDVVIDRPEQVWASDITYIRMRQGFIYLMAILDWFSRYVVAWTVSITLEADFCVEALQRALGTGKPEIFNSDQGPQFTTVLEASGVAISMDGRGRVYDNIFVERLWRSVKYEEVYLKEYATLKAAVWCLGEYFRFHNEKRPHQALGYQTPYQIYAQRFAPRSRTDRIHSVPSGTFSPQEGPSLVLTKGYTSA